MKRLIDVIYNDFIENYDISLSKLLKEKDHWHIGSKMMRFADDDPMVMNVEWPVAEEYDRVLGMMPKNLNFKK